MNLSFDDIMDVIGTFSFALAGSLAGMEKRLDPFGVLIIAFVTAIGGGGIVFFLLQLVANYELAYLAGFIIIVCLRLLALKFNWSLPAWYGEKNKNQTK